MIDELVIDELVTCVWVIDDELVTCVWVIYEPVNLTQEYRQFDFLSPWEGARYILPGDEKAPDAPVPTAKTP